MKRTLKVLKWLGIAVASPVILFLIAAILLYIPPIQNFIVHRVASSLSETTGMNIRIGSVRLAFPLDLAIHNVLVAEKGDTLIDARSMRLDVRLLPLLEGRADIDGVSLYGVKLDTKSYISDTHIKGRIGELTAMAHGVDWQNEQVCVNNAALREADLHITLSDTAATDTTKSETKWNIAVNKAVIEKTNIHLVMPGDSMRIATGIFKAELRDGAFDLGNSYYAIRSFMLRDGNVNYDIPYVKPTQGLDANHLAISALGIQLDTLSYNKDGVLRAGLRRFTLKEKCGLTVNNLSSGIYMDSTTLRLPALALRTPVSKIDADVAFDFRSMTEEQGGHCQAIVDAVIGYEDIRTLATGYVDKEYLNALPHKPLTLKTTIGGNIDRLRISDFLVQIPGVARLSASGYTNYITHPYRNGRINLDLHTQSLAVVRSLLPVSLKQTINVPDGIGAKGWASFKGDTYDADLRVTCSRGSLSAKAHADTKRETYNIAAASRHFPIGSFVKGMPLGAFTGTLRASGSSFDVLSGRATLTAEAKVQDFSYDQYNLGGISLDARLRGEHATANIRSKNAMLPDASANITALIGKKGYDLTLNADIPTIDLFGFGVAKDTLEMGTNISIHATTNFAFTQYTANGSIRNNRFTTPRMSTMAKDILFDFASSADTTTAFVSAGDMDLRLGAKGDIPQLTTQASRLFDELSKQMEDYNIDQERLKAYFPTLSFHLNAGQDNPLYNIARMKGYSFSSAYLNLNTDPIVGMSGDMRVGALNMQALLLDTIDTHILQDSTGIQMVGMIKNEKKNPNPLEIQLKSYLLKSGAGLELAYIDADGDKGVEIGLQAEMQDTGIYVHFYPQHPVIAYRNFTVNKDNYILLGKDNSVSANVDLLADDGTGLKIYGEPKDTLNDLTVSVNRVNLAELSSVLPYLPHLTGMLSGDVHITANKALTDISAMASLEAQEFNYEGTSLGTIGVEAIYLPKTGGEHHASAFISSNGEEVLACNGTYFDRDGGYFEGDAQLHDFPLQMLNGFLVGTDVALKGIAGGELDVKGSLDSPVINGSLDLDSTHIYSDVYGFDLQTDERAIDIKNSRLVFDNYNLYSTGKEPMVLNGTFDMSDFSKMKMDFTMRAQNFELINTKKKAKSMVYGKVYTNYAGTVKGTTDNLSVKGKLEILDKTDVTYILKDSPLSVDDRLNDLVTFTNFADSTATDDEKAVADGGFNLSLGISISDAAQFHCNLSEDGQSYVNLEGGGDLTLRMTPQGDMSMTGRFTVNSGKMKYQLPVIPLKTFDIVEGSYVEFTGDVMNPTLSITAKERTKAVVTEDDKQRSVTFDVGVAISKPLNDMGLEFTIEAPEDLTVQNQLAAMSAEQRGKAAVTMMATGMYITDETSMSGSGFKASNALNAFLQSEIQNIAGSALKTVDINLGVESNTAETGTEITDYSFQFAKRFWGNRISVIIGGKVSTGEDAQNSAASFINNISVEYRLDEGASRYVKVFYDRDTQDPLEGQLTKTGAGLVLKKKTDRLGELFIFKKKKRKE